MRICTDCKQELADNLFDYRGGARKGLQATCKPCSLERLRVHRRKMRKQLDELKMDYGCSECGYNKHPFALHFDHIEPQRKRNRGIAGRAIEVSWSWQKILEEVEKCRVLCANCHAIKTYENKDHLI